MAPSNEKNVIRVLYVDDDPSILEISKQILTDMSGDFDIETACCVDEACKKLSTGKYDVVISDFEMRQKNGLEFLKELREQKNEIPFILFTGKGREEVAIQALNLGADRYFNKHGNPETVYGELAYGIVQLVSQNRLSEKLSVEEERFRQIFSNTPMAVIIYESIDEGEDFVFKDINSAAEKIEKIEKASVLGKRVTNVFPGLKNFGVLEVFKRVIKTGKTEYFPDKLYQDNRDIGSWRENWVIKLPNNNIAAIFNDITERKKAEAELRGTFEVLERVGECIDAGLAVIGKDYRVVWANKRLMDLGVAPNRKCYQTFNHSKKTCPDCGVKKIFEQNTSLDVHEYKTVNSKGEIVWLELRVSPLKDTDGKVTAALELAVPITERKKAEEALKESEKRSRAIIANAPIGIATTGADKHFLSTNEAFCKIIGYTQDELRKLTFKDITYPKDLKESAMKMGELERGRIASFTLEKRYVKKDGTLMDGKIMVSAVRNQNGKPSLFIAELEDITERKKAEEHRKVLESKVNNYSKHLKCMVDLRTVQLKDANERLVRSERLAAIGELAGMVGHDLRNPLAGIKNATYFLKKKGKTISEAQAKETLEIIDKAINHSDKIINDLLDYSREMRLELTKYKAHTLVNDALGMIQVPDRIQIVNHVPEEAWIWVNADKMMRVFINLIKNAVDAMPEKGTVEISSCQAGDCVKIVFSDTGAGIPEEILYKIFTPLFTTKAKGMGFGLAICKRIIEAHGGTITVKTEVNKGTTFTITLPSKPKEPTS